MQNYLDRSMSYQEYLRLIDELVETGRTSGVEQTESRIDFTRLNRQRMARLNKTVHLEEKEWQISAAIPVPMIWLILTEAWCGDAAQNIPVIEKIAAENKNIETRYLLRDENLELMDMFLEDGARSIPKLIAVHGVSLKLLGTWGSRPKNLKLYFSKLKDQGLEKTHIGELLQRWYNEDRGRSLQSELKELIWQWAGSTHTSAAAAVSSMLARAQG